MNVVCSLLPISARSRIEEPLDRGLVARPTAAGQVYFSWRLLKADPPDVAFNVYRQTDGEAAVRLNSAPLQKTTDFVDASAPRVKRSSPACPASCGSTPPRSQRVIGTSA